MKCPRTITFLCNVELCWVDDDFHVPVQLVDPDTCNVTIGNSLCSQAGVHSLSNFEVGVEDVSKTPPWSWKSDYPGAVYFRVQPLGYPVTCYVAMFVEWKGVVYKLTDSSLVAICIEWTPWVVSLNLMSGSCESVITQIWSYELSCLVFNAERVILSRVQHKP